MKGNKIENWFRIKQEIQFLKKINKNEKLLLNWLGKKQKQTQKENPDY